MASITGNLQVDYVITVFFQLLITTVRQLCDFGRYLLIEYPQLAFIALIIVSAIALYYFIKNAVSIIYALVVTVIKASILFSVLFLGAWVYLRGIEAFQEDFKLILHYSQKFNSSSVDLGSYAKSAKRLVDLTQQLNQ